MTVQFEIPDASNEGILTVTIEQADLKPRMDKKVKDLGQKVVLKGFRPGKVPAQLVRKMLGGEVLADIANELLQEGIQNYFAENKHITLLGKPLPIQDGEMLDLKNLEKFDFKFRCGITPTFEYDLDSLYAKDYQVVIDDASIDKIVKQAQQGYGTYAQAEFASSDDIIKGVLYDTLHDYSIEENRIQENEEDSTKFYMETYLPMNQISKATQPHFLDATVGTIVHFDIKELMEDQEKGLHLLTGKEHDYVNKLEGDFAFEVKEIMQKKVSELNEELFQKVLPGSDIKTEEEFRQSLKENVQKHYAHQNLHIVSHKLREQLLENTQIDLPHDFLKAFFMTQNKEVTAEQMEERYPKMEKSARWEIIVSKLCIDMNLQVTEEEVYMEGFDTLMSVYQKYGQSPELTAHISKIAEDYVIKNYAKLMGNVMDRKVLEAIANKLTAAKQMVSEDEFIQIYADFEQGQ